MLAIESVSKELGGRLVLSGVTFKVGRGATLGVVGPNGGGKTTLLRILSGELAPDSGRVELPPGARVGCLAQGSAGRDADAVAAVFPFAFERTTLADRLGEVAALLGSTRGHEFDELSREYDELLERMAASQSGLDLREARGELALRHVEPATVMGQLSGGELTKLGLLDLIAAQPDVLLLDEPTNHLDLAGLEWVEDTIGRFPGVAVVVSHDRVFLDRCASQVLELDGRGKAELFAGNYTSLLAEKARREADQRARYDRQERERAHLKRVVSAIESKTRGIENRTIDFAIRKKAAKVMRRGVTLRARLERELESTDHVDRPEKRMSGFYGEFANAEGGASRLLSVENVALDIDGQRLFEGLTFQAQRGECVIVSGPNGSGKTTLLRAILGEHPVADGELALSGSAHVGYLAQQDDPALGDMDAITTPVQLLRRSTPMPEAEAHNFLHRFLLGHEQATTPVSSLSYGERRRLALALLVRGGANLLILDEPTNHLDLGSREAFEAALEAYEGASIVVTHDRRFIERFADVLVEL